MGEGFTSEINDIFLYFINAYNVRILYGYSLHVLLQFVRCCVLLTYYPIHTQPSILYKIFDVAWKYVELRVGYARNI